MKCNRGASKAAANSVNRLTVMIIYRWKSPAFAFLSALCSSVFTCIGALGTANRTGPLARKYLPGFPLQLIFAKVIR